MNRPQSPIEELLTIVNRLLDPVNGCPWDLKQTHQSLLPYLIEESYEFMHAVEIENFPHMCEELGDILLQVLLHAGKAEKHFNFDDVCQGLSAKLINRHPHIFQEEKRLTSEEVLENWQKIKEQEKADQGIEKSPHSFDEKVMMNTGLNVAKAIGEKSTKLAFDWEDYSQVIYKVEEEWQELKEELPPGIPFNPQRVQEEMGDLLFSVVQLARHLQVDPETALKKANQKFIKRFTTMEDILFSKGLSSKDLAGFTEEQKEHYWNMAKVQAK